MCGPHFCSMKITEDVGKFAVEQKLSDDEALHVGLKQKPKDAALKKTRSLREDLKLRHKTKTATRRKCFISAPFGTDTSQLVEAFRRRNVECLRLDNLKPGAAILDTLQKLVHDVTFVCGVFKGSSPNPNVHI